MSGIPEAGDVGALPAWLQWAFSLGGLIAGAVVVRLGYSRRSAAPEAAKPDAAMQVIGGVIGDRGSAMELVGALDRLAAAINAQVRFWAERDAKARAADDLEEMRQSLLDDLREDLRKNPPQPPR